MPVNLKVTVAAVNFLDYVHVTASKVSAPSTIVWEAWYAAPLPSNFNFIIPNLDPENYYIRYYDAPTNSSLGTFKVELLANALTNEFLYEDRWYTCDGGGATDPVNGDVKITDPYFDGKTVIEFFKEGFRPYEPGTEYDVTGNDVNILTGVALSSSEKVRIRIKYAAGNVSSGSNGGLYAGILTVTAATQTLLAADKNKKIRCFGSAATQVITLCSLSSISADDGFYFDNACGGTAMQVKILLPGGDRIRYNGFNLSLNEFAEFWVSKGEFLLLKKFDDTYWEVAIEYKGVNVGKRSSESFTPAGHHAEDGALSDGDEYPRIWWFINNVLPVTHIITDDTVTTGGYVHPVEKKGLFVKHSTLKKFRWPNTQGLSENGLLNFGTFGTDAERLYDYPGGVQNDQVGEFTETIQVPKGNSYTGNPNQLRFANGANNPQNIGWTIVHNTGKKTRSKNIGVIYCRHI